MGLKTIIDIFDEVCTAYNKTLEFQYGKVWDMNARPSRQYPCVLVESQPNWQTVKGVRPNFKAIKKDYSFKVFIYTTYDIAERGVKPLHEKQEELEVILERYLAEVWRKLDLIGYAMKSNGSGFHGYFEQHNSKLLQVYEGVIITAPVDCDLGVFNYI